MSRKAPVFAVFCLITAALSLVYLIVYQLWLQPQAYEINGYSLLYNLLCRQLLSFSVVGGNRVLLHQFLLKNDTGAYQDAFADCSHLLPADVRLWLPVPHNRVALPFDVPAAAHLHPSRVVRRGRRTVRSGVCTIKILSLSKREPSENQTAPVLFVG